MFEKCDIDGSGDIDLQEFMAGLFPKGSDSSAAWNEKMTKGRVEERIRNKPEPPQLAQGQWTGTSKDLELALQSIISQRLAHIYTYMRPLSEGRSNHNTLVFFRTRTSKESDRIRQAFKLFTSASNITPSVFERRICALMGIKIPQSQCRELFDKFDTDGSGDLDLQEFVSALMPKDYTEVKAVRSFNHATFSLLLAEL